MQLGKFGPKVFEVGPSRVVTFTNLSMTGALTTASEEAAQGKKPATKVKSPGLLKVSVTLSLNVGLGVDVRSEIDSWIALKDAGKEYPLILCGKAASVNKFLLTNCKAGSFVITPSRRSPVVASAELTLEFTEFLPPGAQAVTVAAAAAPSGAGSSSVTVNNAYNLPTSTEKSDMKRTNPGME